MIMKLSPLFPPYSYHEQFQVIVEHTTHIISNSKQLTNVTRRCAAADFLNQKHRASLSPQNQLLLSNCFLNSTLKINIAPESNSWIGTRGPLDMIEIPSHFFEHFIRSRQCLDLCTTDYQTGARLPDQAAEAFQNSLDFMPALRLNDSVML